MPNKRRVLIVDDDADVLETLCELLAINFMPFAARTETQAFDILKREEIDAVICDISLKGGSGIKLLEKCRSLKISVPFVMMTGDVQKEHLLSALRLGAQDVLEKPINLDYLESRFVEVANKGFSLRQIKSGVKKVGALIGTTSSAEDLEFVKEYLMTVEANRLLKKAK
jgi:two-component system, OmpR family, response regulator